MEILSARIDNIPPWHPSQFARHKVSHRCPHNLLGVKEIHFYPKQYAQKTISKMGPGVPWPDSYRAGPADGSLGPEVPKYLG